MMAPQSAVGRVNSSVAFWSELVIIFVLTLLSAWRGSDRYFRSSFLLVLICICVGGTVTLRKNISFFRKNRRQFRYYLRFCFFCLRFCFVCLSFCFVCLSFSFCFFCLSTGICFVCLSFYLSFKFLFGCLREFQELNTFTKYNRSRMFLIFI